MLLFLGSLLLNFIIWQIGFIVFILYFSTLIGLATIFYSIYRMIYLPSNRIYKNWKAYGGTDALVTEIQKIIDHGKRDFESNEFIISRGWIIKPAEFIFVKTSDVNWIYLKQEEGFFDSTTIKQTIRVFTTIGIEFDIKCTGVPADIKKQIEDATTEDVVTYMDVLSHFCKNAIVGYRPEFKVIWKKSPKEFIRNIKRIHKEYQ